MVGILSQDRVLNGHIYKSKNWTCFDLETTNKDYGWALNKANHIVCVSWLENGKQVQTHIGSPLECSEFWEALARADFIIAQNGKFESLWLIRMGFDPTDKVWFDPMLAEWVMLGNNPDMLSLSLDAMCKRYGLESKERLVAAMMNGGICPSEIPEWHLVDRCERDVTTTAQLFQKQLTILEQQHLLACVATRCLHMPVLAQIEKNGIYLDKDKVEQVHAEYTQRYQQLQQQMRDMVGGQEINENSPNQMIPLIYGIAPATVDEETAEQLTKHSLNFEEVKDRRGKPKRGKISKAWPDGRPQLNKQTIAALEKKAKTKKQKAWIELRKEIGQVNAAITKNLDFFLGVVRERDCLFYAEIMQGIAATHRTTGRGKPQSFELFDGATKSVQSQNMPQAFKSLQTVRDKSYKASDADGKNLEFFFAAYLGRDKQALSDIRNPDFDAHLQTLTVMLNGSFDRAFYNDLLKRYRAGDKKVKEQRANNALCKSHTFKPLFGGERGTPEQEKYYKWFREHYSGVTETAGQWLQAVEDTASKSAKSVGQLRVETGMRFFWYVGYRNTLSINTKTGKPLKTSVGNYPIQNLATGESVPIATAWTYHRLKHSDIRALLTNTVHDNVSAEVHKDDKRAWYELIEQAWSRDVFRHLKTAYGIALNIPLGIEITFGDHLGEGEVHTAMIENEDIAA